MNFSHLSGLILVAFTVWACSKPMNTPPFQTHRFGDRVFVEMGFYKSCSGRVVDYRYVVDSLEYKITGRCNSADGRFAPNLEFYTNALNLIEDSSDENP